MTDQQVQNTAFKTECIKTLSAIFSEVSEMMCNENGKYTPFCKQLGTMFTRFSTMDINATDDEREEIRRKTRSDFITLIDTVKEYGLKAIYEAGEPRG